ncbi:MAG: hypothetical protein KAR42_03865 [candidate division Zixibacteria bacterium]|nr:hypothetical protein [candidate division Zixibacteria bacterium]
MYARIYQAIVLLIVVLSTISILGCGKTTDPKTNFQYPLQVGNNWEFSLTNELYNIRGDQQAAQDVINSMQSGRAVIKIIGKDVVDSTIETYVMQSSITQGDVVFVDSGKTYVNNTAEGLIIYYANNRIGFTLHKPKQTGYLLQYNNQLYSSFEELTASVPRGFATGIASACRPGPQPLVDYDDYLTLAYPLHVGKTWIATFSTSIGHLRKTIDRFEDITVPAGDFSCYVIDNTWWQQDSGVISLNVNRVDHISAQGLIKRVIAYHDIYIVDETSNILATVDMTTTYMLTDLDLQ